MIVEWNLRKHMRLYFHMKKMHDTELMTCGGTVGFFAGTT
jgi:hypothetical protein